MIRPSNFRFSNIERHQMTDATNPAPTDSPAQVLPAASIADAAAQAIAAATDVGPAPVTSTSHLGDAPAGHIWFGTGLWKAISDHIGQLPFQIVQGYRTLIRDVFKNNDIDLANPQSTAAAPTHVSVPVGLINQTIAFLQNRPFDEVENLLTHVGQHLQALAQETEAMVGWKKAKAEADVVAASAVASANDTIAAAAPAPVVPATPAAPVAVLPQTDPAPAETAPVATFGPTGG